MTSEIIKKALARAQAMIAAAQKKVDSRKLSPEELAQRRAAKAEREQARKIIAEAKAEANRLLGIEENAALDEYMASADAKFAVGIVRARRPGEGTDGAKYWDTAFAIAQGEEFSEPNAPKWNARLVKELLDAGIGIDEKRAQTVAVNIKKVVLAVAEGYMTTDGQLTAAGEGVVQAHKQRVAELEQAIFDETEDDDEGDEGVDV